jgi:hypothetical protein
MSGFGWVALVSDHCVSRFCTSALGSLLAEFGFLDLIGTDPALLGEEL